MTIPTLYSIGWGYNYPRSTPLKSLFLHPACPFRPAAIVHDVSWVDRVDGIPIISTEEFLRIARQTSPRPRVILQLQEPTQRQIWLRRAHEYGLEVFDEGQLLRATAEVLISRQEHCDIRVAHLPQAFDDGVTAQLAELKPLWADASSDQIFHAYLQFLRTGLLSSFERVWRMLSPHPLAKDGHSFLRDQLDSEQEGLAWEIAEQRSNFIEQTVLLGGRRWRYAFSAPTADAASTQAHQLRFAMATLPVSIAASVCRSDGTQEKLCDFEMPQCSDDRVVARIDLNHPAEWVNFVATQFCKSALSVSLGRHPGQLLQVLHRLPPGGSMKLRCDRPGPLGLVLEWSKGDNAP